MEDLRSELVKRSHELIEAQRALRKLQEDRTVTWGTWGTGGTHHGKRWGKGGENVKETTGTVGFMMLYHVFHGCYKILQFVWWGLPFCSIFLIVFLLGWGESCFSKWTDVTMNISTVSTVNVEHSYSIMLIVPIYLF